MHKNVPHIKVPVIFFTPSFACTINEIKNKFKIDDDIRPEIYISENSMLYLTGKVLITSLNLNGALVLESNKDYMSITNLKINNKGFTWVPINPSIMDYANIQINERLKKYKFEKNELF